MLSIYIYFENYFSFRNFVNNRDLESNIKRRMIKIDGKSHYIKCNISINKNDLSR